MSEIYKFNDFRLNKKTRRLYKGEQPLHLSPRAYGILIYLVERQGQIVTKDELIQAVWNDAFVEESNLAVHVSSLRNLLGEKRGDDKYIQTITGQGYSFVSDIETVRPGFYPGELTKTADRITPAIAVLPFRNKTEDSELDFLANAISESLVSNLSHIPQLKVIAYSAVSRYIDSKIDTQEIAFILGADKILCGSILNYDNEVEITAELVSVDDLSLIWSSQYRTLNLSFFETKKDIVNNIVAAFKQIFKAPKPLPQTDDFSGDAEASRLFLKGKKLLGIANKRNFLTAVKHFGQAIKLDSNYSSAHVGLAQAYCLLGTYFFSKASEVVPKCQHALDIALELNPRLSEAYAIRGFLRLFYDFNIKAVEQNLIKALSINPNNATAHCRYGILALNYDNVEKSINSIMTALELDPLSPTFNGSLTGFYYLTRQYSKAITQAHETLELYPDLSYGHYWLAFAYVHLEATDKAIEEIDRALLIQRNNEILSLKGYILARSGRRSKALEIINALIKYANRSPIDFGDIAHIYSALGENDKAFEYLEKARLYRMNHFCILKVDPRFDNIRSDPRFDEFLKKIGLL